MDSANLEEYKNLQKSILEVERLWAASPQLASHLFVNFLRNANLQLAVLKEKIEKEEKNEIERVVAAAEAAKRERSLNEEEQNTFGDFLKKKFFTRDDMARVDAFYKDSWDRLSDEGKEALSFRTWEGVRQGEYKISELPNAAKKEAEWLYTRFKNPSPGNDALSQIPSKDREDFIRVYEQGKGEEVAAILDRPCFANNVSISDANESKSREVKGGSEVEADDLLSAMTKPTDIPRPAQLVKRDR